MLIGVLGLFGSIILGVGSTMIKGFPIPMPITLLITMGLGMIVSLFVIIYDIMTSGIAGVCAKSKMNGEPIAMVLRNDKKLKFSTAKIKDGLAQTKEFGTFLIMPDSIYSLPNGSNGFIAYHKYGVNLHPNFVRATTVLRSSGMENIEDVESANKEARSRQEEYNVMLDKKLQEKMDENKNKSG